MPEGEQHWLPKDPRVEGREPIRSVAEYIERVEAYIKTRRAGEQIYVFRGEPQVYSRPCIPGLFRREHLANNKFFEKNLFDAMRQNKLTASQSYLENAIEAQHGEFPSRLLDVSYNCLVALYFAVTPYYHYSEDRYDDEDGMVFLIFVNQVYSPSARNTNNIYNSIINRNREWFYEPLFQKNHKFIDHAKLCNRIVAQQGAFILFQGDVAEDMPKGSYYGIRIAGGAKKRLRKELKTLFGIHTGSIYPEIENLAQEMTEKSRWLVAEKFTLDTELRFLLKNLEEELEYYLGYVIEIHEKNDANTKKALGEVGEVIHDYQERIILFILRGKDRASAVKLKNDYNNVIERFAHRLKEYGVCEFLNKQLKDLMIHMPDNKQNEK